MRQRRPDETVGDAPTDRDPARPAGIRPFEREELKRDLRSRHLRMIAIGGAIGTGLFYGSAGAIQSAGPAVILVYIVIAAVIYLIMRALGEMSVAEPVSGGWVSYSTRYVHPFLGFLNGWNVVLFLLATTAADLNALGVYVQFWLPGMPIWVTGLVAVAIVLLVNTIGVKYYGESEFWFAIVKVAAIILMIAFAAGMIFFGLGHQGRPVGFGNLGEHGGFVPHGFTGIFLSVALVSFAFGGIENLALAAGETKDPVKEIPKAVNSTSWRLVLFYVLGITALVTVFPWTSLTGQASPFVQVFAAVGIPAAASIMNIVVITAVLSAVNASVFSDTRILYNLSLQKKAPRFLSSVSRRSVPAKATAFVFSVMLVGVLLNLLVPKNAFEIFATITVFGLVCNWTSILLSHLNFRRLHRQAGREAELTYKAPFYPYADIIGLIFMVAILASIGLNPKLQISLVVSAIWLVVVFIAYVIYARRRRMTGREPGLDTSTFAVRRAEASRRPGRTPMLNRTEGPTVPDDVAP